MPQFIRGSIDGQTRRQRTIERAQARKAKDDAERERLRQLTPSRHGNNYNGESSNIHTWSDEYEPPAPSENGSQDDQCDDEVAPEAEQSFEDNYSGDSGDDGDESHGESFSVDEAESYDELDEKTGGPRLYPGDFER
jgi:hypothetical protein